MKIEALVRLKFPRSSKIAHTIPLEQEANHIGYIVRKTAIPNLRECTIDGYAPWTKQNGELEMVRLKHLSIQSYEQLK